MNRLYARWLSAGKTERHEEKQAFNNRLPSYFLSGEKLVSH
jgi:hypothetical protein